MASGCDGDIQQLALAADDGLDQAAAGRALDRRVGQFLLCAHELVLHLRRSCEQLLHVQLSAWLHDAPKPYWHPRFAGVTA